MKRAKKSSAAQAVGRSGRTACWPLSNEWDTFIPPQAVITKHSELFGTRPVWNEDWLRGLEAYVRSIVRDEICKANTTVTVPPLAADKVDELVGTEIQEDGK